MAQASASVRQELDEDAEYAADAAPPGAAAAAGAAATAVPMASAVDAPLDQALRDAMSLVWRVLLAWLAVLALFVVAGWVN